MHLVVSNFENSGLGTVELAQQEPVSCTGLTLGSEQLKLCNMPKISSLKRTVRLQKNFNTNIVLTPKTPTSTNGGFPVAISIVVQPTDQISA